MWPSISPWNIYDLQWRHWVRIAREADDWVAARTMTPEGGKPEHG